MVQKISPKKSGGFSLYFHCLENETGIKTKVPGDFADNLCRHSSRPLRCEQWTASVSSPPSIKQNTSFGSIWTTGKTKTTIFFSKSEIYTN